MNNDFKLVAKYDDISKTERPKIPAYHGDMFIDVEQEYLMRKELQKRINKALKFIDSMFDDGNGDKIIDNLLKLEKILKGE